MGCSLSGIMSMFNRPESISVNSKINMERKLYLARESPEPIFDLSDCQLHQVPPGIYSICKVFRKDFLYLNNNKLSSLEGGGELQDLYLIKVLNISCNRFTELQCDIKHLVSLSELYIQDNNLNILPDNLHTLKSLTIIDVSNNRLKLLTSSLGKLQNLRKLNITGNPELNKLCPELCEASNLTTLELNGDQFIFPPPEITMSSTSDIMKYLCNFMNKTYTPPSCHSDNVTLIQSPSSLQNPFTNHSVLSWEEQEAHIIQQESLIHEASKQQREVFMSNILKEQYLLDTEIAKVQKLKEIDRQKLIRTIQEDEKLIEMLVNNFLSSTNLNPEVIQQQLEYEEAELNRILDITRQNYENIKRNDIILAMETLIQENCAFQKSKKKYEDNLGNMKKNFLAKELEATGKLEKLLQAKDESHSALVEQLLEDQDIQKAVVASLLERIDTSSWSLNQEISLITSHLAKLSIIEQEKQKLHVTYNYNQLLHQRVQLLGLLDELLEQQNKRRTQLVAKLKEMESESTLTVDFWLKNYQKLIDSAPKTLLDMGKTLDPQLANNLLHENVIHCLPFLVKFLFTEETLLEVTDEKLKDNGVLLSADRMNVLRAIKNYIHMKTNNERLTAEEESNLSNDPKIEPNCTGILDSDDIVNSTADAECVICMDAKCEVVFVPCGHMCCCIPCSENELKDCPMCRQEIERKIRAIIP